MKDVVAQRLLRPATGPYAGGEALQLSHAFSRVALARLVKG
jgi:hypothetical protein